MKNFWINWLLCLILSIGSSILCFEMLRGNVLPYVGSLLVGLLITTVAAICTFANKE